MLADMTSLSLYETFITIYCTSDVHNESKAVIY